MTQPKWPPAIPGRFTCVWNRIPDTVRGQVVQLALDEPELSPRELATRFTDTKNYFVSEASVYRLLKEHDLIASPAYIVMHQKRPRPVFASRGLNRTL